MKKTIRYFIFSLFLFFTSLLNAQEVEYVPFPTDTAKWREAINLQGFESGMPYTEEGYDYYVLGDTIFDGIQYQKLYFRDSHYYIEDQGNLLNGQLKFLGGIREDSLKRIYFLYKTNNEPYWELAYNNFTIDNEYILYDFNIEIGDTIDWLVYELSSHSNTLIDIDTIELDNGQLRKKYIFDSYDWLTDRYWISGIGSSHGIFGPYKKVDPSIVNPRLICFRDNNISTTVEPSTRLDEAKDCVFYFNQNNPTNVPEEESNIEVESLEIYPNPVENSLTIDTHANTDVSVKIFSINSKLINSKNSNTGQFNIDLSDLPPGIYIIQLNSQETQINKKFIKL